MLTREKLRETWTEAVKNREALDGCSGPHAFVDTTTEQLFGKRYRCTRCGGTVESLHRHWYESGRAHATAAAAAALTAGRWSVSAGPPSDLFTALVVIEKQLGRARAQSAIRELLAIDVNGGTDIDNLHVTRLA